MNQSFNYRAKYSWGFSFLALIGIVAIVYAVLQPFNIRLGSRVIFEYPTSMYVVIVIGTLFILYAIHKFLKMRAINSSTEPVVVLDHEIIFNDLVGYSLKRKSVLFTNVNELWSRFDKDDGNSMILYADQSRNKYEFFAENFDSPSLYEDFKNALEANCTNITNRR